MWLPTEDLDRGDVCMNSSWNPLLVVAAAALAAFGAAPAFSASLFVDADDPECGQSSSPFCTLAAAAATALEGDTILVRSSADTETVRLATAGVRVEALNGAILDVGCQTAIEVVADDVSIIGFTIRNAELAIAAERVAGLLIAGSDLIDVGAGISLEEVTESVVVGNRLVGSELCDAGRGIESWDGGGNDFDRNHVIGFDNDGFLIDESGDRLTENSAEENGSEGFRVRGDGHEIVANESWFNDAEGFQLDDDGNFVERNHSVRNGAEGFKIEGTENEIADNRAEANKEDGFLVDDEASSNRLTNNRSIDNVEDGFDINFDSNVLIENVAIGNGDEGFEVEGDGNYLENNVSRSNSDDGFELDFANAERFAEDNTLLRNSSENNLGGGFDIEGDRNVLRFNRASGNGSSTPESFSGDGFVVEGSNNEIVANVARENAGDGFRSVLEPGGDRPALGEGNVFTRNRSIHNAGSGFFIAPESAAGNTYVKNLCTGNGTGSEPDGLCWPDE